VPGLHLNTGGQAPDNVTQPLNNYALNEKRLKKRKSLLSSSFLGQQVNKTII
jgi:hypothetical protein